MSERKIWPSVPRCEGMFSKQAHTDLPKGTFEREFGRDGFFGPASHIYHTHAPTSWRSWDGPLRPRAFDAVQIKAHSYSPWDASPLMFNAHMRLRQWRCMGNMKQLVANGDGDELLFVHSGEGNLFCDFGHMSFKEGDYIVIPRACMWRIECDAEVIIWMIEATEDGYRLPEKGLVGRHAIFDPAVLEVPEINKIFKGQYSSTREWQLVIKRRNELTTVTYDYNPLDAVGWHGDHYPVKLNWRDIRPLMSHRYHVPPSAHTTFLASRFVVCTFVPRPLESDAGALKVPFYHSNNEFDEILLYHKGEFFSRDNIHPGMITLHPCGFSHGPHPKAVEESKKGTRKETNEVAVMIDTKDAVTVSPEAAQMEWHGYIDSWKSTEKDA